MCGAECGNGCMIVVISVIKGCMIVIMCGNECVIVIMSVATS